MYSTTQISRVRGEGDLGLWQVHHVTHMVFCATLVLIGEVRTLITSI